MSASLNNCFPAVSILMPVFNAGLYLAEAVESVLAQTGAPRWELLLVDDGSTDNSVAVAEKYRSRYPQRIQMYAHPGRSNRGTSASRNLALRHARAPRIAMLDADDVWLPHMLEQQAALLDRHPEAAMAYANAERAWDLSRPFGSTQTPDGYNSLPPLLPTGVRPGLLRPPHPLPWFLHDETLVPCTCTVLVKTFAARAVGGFVDSFQGLYDDQAFYAKLSLAYPTVVSTECVARYRRHHLSCCAKAWDDEALQRQARLRFEAWLVRYQSRLSAAEPELTAAD